MASKRADSPQSADDPHDTNFDPEAELSNATRSSYSTPRSNISRGSRVPAEAKAKLYRLAPNGQRCLLTHDIEPLECCHVVPRATNPETVEQLEHAWGLDPGKLHIHTTRNLIILRSEMHARFDRNDWALVPTVDVINMALTSSMAPYLDSGVKIEPYKTLFPDQVWEYHFVAFRPSPKAFLRYLPDGGSRPWEIHQYPYDNLGLIKSQIHPYFAIYNAGKKVVHHRKPNSDARQGPHAHPNNSHVSQPGALHPHKDFQNLLDSCEQLYKLWTRPQANRLLAPPPMPQRPSSPSSRSLRSSRSSQGGIEPKQGGEQNKQISGHKVKHQAQSRSSSQKHQDAGSFQTLAHSLPTPEQSQMDSRSHPNLTQFVLEGDRPPCRQSRVHRWAEDSKLVDLSVGQHGSKSAEHCLALYRQEMARRPPAGPWEGWVPEYELT